MRDAMVGHTFGNASPDELPARERLGADEMMTIPIDAVRVYLDTGVLARIADQEANRTEVLRLRDAMADAGAVLVLSGAHVLDMVRNTDDATRLRFGDAVDTFECAAFVLEQPIEGERPALDRALAGQMEAGPRWDITLRRIERASYLTLFDGATVRMMETAAAQVTAFGDASVQGYEARAGLAQPAGRTAQLLSIVAAMMKAASPEELVESEPSLAAALAAAPDAGARSQLLATIREQWPLLTQVKAQAKAQAAALGVPVERWLAHSAKHPASTAFGAAGVSTKGGFPAWLEAARVAAPGTYLAARLAKANASASTRRPDHGDIVDRIHATLVPYADVATVDAHNYAHLVPALRDADRVRGVALLRNPGDSLQPLITVIESLPRNAR